MCDIIIFTYDCSHKLLVRTSCVTKSPMLCPADQLTREIFICDDMCALCVQRELAAAQAAGKALRVRALQSIYRRRLQGWY